MIKMKDSGIEWIGQIPESWKIDTIGKHFKNRKVKVSDKDYSPLSVAKIGIIPQLENVAKSDASDDRKLVCKGDFVINSRSDRKQSSGFSQYDGSVSLINIVLEPRNIFAPFTNYLLKNYGFAEEFYRWGHGIVADLWTTSWEEMKKISLPLPSKELQKTIVNFLDKKCFQIDKLIKLQEEEINKIKEYKQSVITETVTKGIDPKAKMKDSEIEWIGQTPEDWSINVFKYEYRSRDEKYITGDFDYIALENVESKSGKYIKTESNQFYELNSSKMAYKNDVIYGKLRPYLSKSLMIDKKCCVSSEFAIFTPMNGNSASFLNSLFLSQKFTDIINSSTYGIKMPRVNIDFIRNLKIAIPKPKEQKDIEEFINKKCSQIDELIKVKFDKIKNLQEYKKSLIYEYVTGKKECK